jgi:predicted metal-dependent peptidase
MNFKTTKDFLIQIQKTKNKTLVDQHLLDTLLEDRKNILDLNIIVCIDVSGSISRAQYKQFMAQVDSIKGLSRVKIIETDTDIVAMYDYFKMESYRVVRLKGGGGTNFKKALDQVKNMKPDAVLFMTDGHVSGAASNPLCPVGWVLTRDGKQPFDFGEIVCHLD